MNQGIFRLVYSQVLNMYVPASEATRNKTGKSGGSKASDYAKQILLAGIASTSTNFVWAADLPPGIVPTGQWVGAQIKNSTINSMVVQQTATKAIQDFNKFNLNKGDTYTQLMGKKDSALLRIHDIDPSRINGNVKAEGNLYMVNKNGIVFGKDSQVNAGTLYAGSLEIDENLFKTGLLSNPNRPVFIGETGYVAVEEGAKIFADTGGRVILLAPNVENKGLISTPDGQTILAAGKKVYLQSLTTTDTEPAKGGVGGTFVGENPAHLLVEVDSGGTATNIGKIIADRGNVSVVGMAVNQQGVISASTSVRANGTIKLLAREGVSIDTSDVNKNTPVPLLTTKGGKITFGKDSVTEVRVETTDKEEITKAVTDKVPFQKSNIKIAAKDVEIDGKMIAKGGDVDISNPLQVGGASNPVQTNRVYLGENSVIDVSGVDATAPMSRNQLKIQLFSDQLKDVPLSRGSDLFKKTVYVDARKGTALTDITPFVNNKGKTVAELMVDGGTVSLSGETIQRKGSVLNVSGGSITYEVGNISETMLNVNGKSVAISKVDPKSTIPTLGDTYSKSNSKWGVTRYWDVSGGGTTSWGSRTSPVKNLTTSTLGSQIASYKVGANAGKVTNAANATSRNGVLLSAFTVMDGAVLANTFIGDTQRGLSTKPVGDTTDVQFKAPLGGAIDLAGNFSAQGEVLAADFNVDSKFDNTQLRKINTDFLKDGFNRLNLMGAVNTDLNVAPAGSVNILGTVNANINAPSSNVTIQGNVKSGSTINTAGLFTNDTAGVDGALAKPVAINAGNINVVGNSYGGNFNANAGLWQAQGAGSANKGKAGNISIQVDERSVSENSQLQAYGFDKGGELTVDAQLNTHKDKLTSVSVEGQAEENTANFKTDFFKQGGFSKYLIKSNDAFTIGDGSKTNIMTNMQTLRTNAGYASLASGSDLSLAVSPWLAPDYLRKASSLDFSAGNALAGLILNQNASITTDVGGKVNLSSPRKLTVLGNIDAPAGEVNLKVTGSIAKYNYESTDGLFIGTDANISSKGVYRQLPSNNGIIKAELLNAGGINVSSSLGSAVLKEGSLLDVSAASGKFDRKIETGYKREVLNGDAGSINIAARDGLLLDGDFKANANGAGRGGNLTISTIFEPASEIIYPNIGTDFKVTQNKVLTAGYLNSAQDIVHPVDLSSESNILNIVGHAQISVDQINQAGFDNLTINNNFGKEIAFEAGTNFTLPGKLTLQSPLLSVTNVGDVTLNASYIDLKQGVTTQANPSNLNTSDNTLTLNADEISINRQIAVNNVKRTTLNASKDITGAGDNSIAGGLNVPNQLVLTARNIYPNTAAKLNFEAVGTDSTLTVNKSSVADKSVLSAQGQLKLKADNIVQNGSLKAPFGMIALDAKKSLTLGQNSLTSISGEGQLIPYGVTKNSGQIYRTESYKGSTSDESKLIDKKIVLNSNTIQQESGAKLDVSGGGDMFAYEFIKGIGGSEDVLKQPNYFAISPSFGKDYAPNDTIYQADSSAVKVGDAVYISGISGLPSGTYTLLPARYALMPGTFLVQAGVKSSLLPGQMVSQIDGSSLTTGFLSTLGTETHDAQWSTFKVQNSDFLRPAAGTTSRSPSEYLITSANDYFTKQATKIGTEQSLPKNAGQLVFNASSNLSLNGDIIANKAADARGALVDINSENIRVVANKDTGTNALQLKASDINKLNAESVLLGGTRSKTDNGTDITTSAKTVSIENNTENALLMPEFIVSAKDSVMVKSGAVINSRPDTKNTNKTNVQSNGNGALLAVSGVNDITYRRTGAGANPTQGVLNIESGANINATKSLVLDATKQATLKGSVKVDDGGSATFGANRILLGSPSPEISGLSITNTGLADLGKLSRLDLNSYKNVDIYSVVDFGNNALDLNLNAAGLVGHMATSDTANIIAKQFTLKNTAGAVYEESTSATDSTLNILAANVSLEGSTPTNTSDKGTVTKLAGFDSVNISTNTLKVAKTGATEFESNKTTLNVGKITADTGGDYQLKGKDLTVTSLTNLIASDSSKQSEGIGAKLVMNATNLNIGSNISLAAGNLSLISEKDLVIANGANVSAKSTSVTFYDKAVATPAGNIKLTSTNGHVNINNGSVIDVSSVEGADAGKIILTANNASKNGTVNIEGELKGNAGEDKNGKKGNAGSLVVDVDQLTDISNTNQQAKGFDTLRQYRIRNQADVNVTGKGENALKAQEVIISADNGSLNVSGEINAISAKNGYIGLFAKNNVNLESTAKLLANSTQTGAKGGRVEIGTLGGNNSLLASLDLKEGSVIDVGSGAGGIGGDVYLRAPRNFANDDINISNLTSTIIGASKVQAEGFKTYSKTNIVIDDQTTFLNDSESFLTSVIGDKSKGISRLGLNGNTAFSIVPGVEVQSTNNLTVDDDWVLNTWRFDADTGKVVVDEVKLTSGLSANNKELLAGVLTLRAAKGLTFNGSLSDGLKLVEATTLKDKDGNEILNEFDEPITIPENTQSWGIQSWKYNLVAGADFSAAKITNTVAKDTQANFKLAADKLIRTGTSDINIAASNNIEMGNSASVIYTSGQSAEKLIGFDAPEGDYAYFYQRNGGDINIDANGNINGAELKSRQMINNWLFRQGGGTDNLDVTWGIIPDLFNQSLATLGGGNIKINVAGDINNFSALLPTSGRFDTNGATGNQSILGGGNLNIKVQGNINNGTYFVGRGVGNIVSGGSIQKSADSRLGTVLALQDATFNVNAKDKVFIEAALNPTMLAQSQNTDSTADKSGKSAFFNTFSSSALINTQSLTSDITFNNAASNLGTGIVGLHGTVEGRNYFPGSLLATAFGSDINVLGLNITPSPTGNLELFAKNNIKIDTLNMSDADPNVFPNQSSPVRQLESSALDKHASSLLHINDELPIMIVANNGSITSSLIKSDGTYQDVQLTLPKKSKIVAGTDVSKLSVNMQNNSAEDVTLIQAGRDIIGADAELSGISLAGPGELLITAGRNIDLGNSKGVETIGNAQNAALPRDGASITLQAGLGKEGATVDSYIAQYISPTGAGPAVLKDDANKLAEYRTKTSAMVTGFIRKIKGDATLTDDQALDIFNGLSRESKSIFAYRHLSSELLASGESFAKTQNNIRGDNAIAELFPKSDNTGDITLYNSKVSTKTNGSIDMLTPNGLINAGLAGGGNKTDIGIITEQGGAIRAFADDGFLVNQSKVITQFGSDITVWVNNGDIDAGRGSKSATAIPQRIVSTDIDGNTTVENRGVASGSGIRAQTYDPDGPNNPQEAPKKGKVALIAPRGKLDAGEAGIEAGDFLAVAPIVLNAGNISVAGASQGVPVTASGPIEGATAGLSPDATSAGIQDSVKQAANQASQPPAPLPVFPSLISVEIIGFGS